MSRGNTKTRTRHAGRQRRTCGSTSCPRRSRGAGAGPSRGGLRASARSSLLVSVTVRSIQKNASRARSALIRSRSSWSSPMMISPIQPTLKTGQDDSFIPSPGMGGSVAARLAPQRRRWKFPMVTCIPQSWTGLLTVLVSASLVAVAVAACGSDDPEEAEGASGGAAAKGDPAKDKLAQIQARGTLVEYFEDDYPPQSMSVKGATRPAGHQVRGQPAHGAPRSRATKRGPEAHREEARRRAVLRRADVDRGDRRQLGRPLGHRVRSGSINADRMQRLYMTQPYYAPSPTCTSSLRTRPYRKPGGSQRQGDRRRAADCSHGALPEQ